MYWHFFCGAIQATILHPPTNSIREICPYCGHYMKAFRTDPLARFADDNHRIGPCLCGYCHAIVDFLVTPHTTVKGPAKRKETCG